MWKICGKYEDICGNKEKYVENKEYVALATRRAKHRTKRGASRQIPFSLYKNPGKIPSFPPLFRLWNLEERSEV